MNRLLKTLLQTGLYLLDHSTERTLMAKERIQEVGDHLRKRIYHEPDHTLRNALTFGAGVAVGVGVAVLYAPASGIDTRQAITNKMQDFGNGVRERFSKEQSTVATQL